MSELRNAHVEVNGHTIPLRNVTLTFDKAEEPDGTATLTSTTKSVSATLTLDLTRRTRYRLFRAAGCNPIAALWWAVRR